MGSNPKEYITMMTMNYFWWLFRDTMLYWMSKRGISTIESLNYPGIKYTMDFMVDLEESIAQKLERQDEAKRNS